MRARTPIDPSLHSKHLFIEHLAARLGAMERGALPLSAVAYRLYAKRLRQATAGYPEAHLAERLSVRHPVVAEIGENRHFDTHGAFRGPQGTAARRAADALLARLTPA